MIYFDKLGVLLRSPSDPPDVLERFSFLDRRWITYGQRAGAILEELQRIDLNAAVALVFSEVENTDEEQARAMVETEDVRDVPLLEDDLAPSIASVNARINELQAALEQPAEPPNVVINHPEPKPEKKRRVKKTFTYGEVEGKIRPTGVIEDIIDEG